VADAPHEELLTEGVVEHLYHAGSTFIRNYVEYRHDILVTLHVMRHRANIKEAIIAVGTIRLKGYKGIHYFAIGIELWEKDEIHKRKFLMFEKY